MAEGEVRIRNAIPMQNVVQLQWKKKKLKGKP